MEKPGRMNVPWTLRVPSSLLKISPTFQKNLLNKSIRLETVWAGQVQLVFIAWIPLKILFLKPQLNLLASITN